MPQKGDELRYRTRHVETSKLGMIPTTGYVDSNSMNNTRVEEVP